MGSSRDVQIFKRLLLLTVTFTLIVAIAADEVTEDKIVHQLLIDLAKQISRLTAQQTGSGNSAPSTDVAASVIGK